MNKTSEVDELIDAVKKMCPDVLISQRTSFGEKPFEIGVWKLWLKDNEDVYVNIEVHQGMLNALYANKEFENKYPIDATKICNFLKEFNC
jgi:hypothetical protein